MNMKKIIFIIILAFTIVAVGRVNAQHKGYTSFQYAMGIPAGDLNSFISKPSFRGFLFEYRRNITDNISAGLDLGWNVFYERKSNDTYTVKDASISGVQYRYSNEFPMLVSIDYSFSQGNKVQPYASFGIGTIYSLRDTDMGIYRYEQDAWHFGLKPEIGAIFEMSDVVGFKLAAKYYHGFAAGDLESQGYFSVSAGLAFRF
jgi:hypothetical protein